MATRSNNILFIMVSLALGVAAYFCGSQTYASAESKLLAEVVVNFDFVQWIPIKTKGAKSVLLSISTPDGAVIKRTFSLGDTPTYPMSKDDPLNDGTYGYELYLAKDRVFGIKSGASTPQALKSGEEFDANGRPLRQTVGLNPFQPVRRQVQSGFFTVFEGVIQDPTIQAER